MSDKPINIKLNLKGVTQPLFNLINECQNVILFELRIIEHINEFPENTLEEIRAPILQIGDPPKDLDSQKDLIKNWLIKKGFEDLAKGIKLSLIEAFYYSSLLQKSDEIKNLKTFTEEINSLRKTAIEQSLPGLLSKVKPFLIKRFDYENEIISINNARNCLIHADGIVTDRHINDKENNQLIIKGNRFIYFFEKEGERYPMEFGKPGPENAALKMGAEKFEIRFNPGDRIKLDLKDFSDFITTCLYFGLDLKECLPKN